jgi:hypothetical protein
MKPLAYFLLFTAVLISCQPGQKPETEPAAGAPVSVPEPVFPTDWLGDWKGELKIWNNGGLVRSIPMELQISATDSAGLWNWGIVYLQDGKPDNRPYLLRAVDTKNGLYQVDELNGILLDSYLLGNVFFTRFSVMESLLLSSYRLEGDKLVFELISGKTDQPSLSGGVDDIPEVGSYPIVVLQRAILEK